MMKAIVLFYDLAKQAIESTRTSDEPVTYYVIKTKLGSMEAVESMDGEYPVGSTVRIEKIEKFENLVNIVLSMYNSVL